VAIDWSTPLQQIAADGSRTANALRAKVTAAGLAYDRAGRPDVLQESNQHKRWRVAVLSRLSACDRIAASIDGKPLTVIEPRSPSAKAITIKQRLMTAAHAASPALASLIMVMMKSPLPAEPPEFIGAYYASSGIGDQSMGEIEHALISALAELHGYLAL
jgi:hypothetical protein